MSGRTRELTHACAVTDALVGNNAATPRHLYALLCAAYTHSAPGGVKEDMMNGFKSFLLRGNVIDLAIAVVIGAAFGVIVSALVKDLITPLIAAIGGKPDFSGLYFTINNSKFLYGDFINAIITFLIIAAVIYYLVVVPMNRLMERVSPQPKKEVTTKECPYCISTIPLTATRCAFCTQELAA
jgi:large conductance mechanosensitive channel